METKLERIVARVASNRGETLRDGWRALIADIDVSSRAFPSWEQMEIACNRCIEGWDA